MAKLYRYIPHAELFYIFGRYLFRLSKPLLAAVAAVDGAALALAGATGMGQGFGTFVSDEEFQSP